MADQSVFTEKKKKPGEAELKTALGKTFAYWQSIVEFVRKEFPGAIEEWNFPGEKYGWSFRLKDKKRVIVYLLPREKFFKVAFVFGQKATDAVLKSNVNDAIKNELSAARVYAEGRGIRIDVKEKKTVKDVQELVRIKLAN